MRKPLHLALLLLVLTGCSSSSNSASTRPTITLATYNVEHFADHFRGHHMEQAATTRPVDAETKDLIAFIKRANTENQWEVANVITDPAFSPDILAIEEGPEQPDLDYFNKKWLNGMYATVIVFPSNTQYHQTVDLLLKPGFKILDRRDQYFKEPDTAHNARGSYLFARGPAFLLVQAPTGYTFWVGATHQKSKSKNSLESTQWRNREAKRTHEILKEIEHTDHHDVVLLGDMNDDLGLDEYESKPDSGGDSISLLVGPPSDGFVLATRSLAEKKEISFHGYDNPKYRSFIDHAILSSEMAPRLQSVKVFQNQWTPVASDHFPVMLKINAAPTTDP
jgi:endonuclease/exonuclease/phosphatase family metal-dependent hydrolase